MLNLFSVTARTEKQIQNFGSLSSSNCEDFLTEPMNEQSADDHIDSDTSASESDNEEDSCCIHQYWPPSRQRLKTVFNLIFGWVYFQKVFILLELMTVIMQLYHKIRDLID